MAKIKVGIIEDDKIIAVSLKKALSQLGYLTTEAAKSYTEGLKMVDMELPDILLIDVQLNGEKDGIDLATTLQENYNIPFIFLTGNSDAKTLGRAKKLNPPAYLVKPFKKEELYTSIEICLHNFSVAQEKKEFQEKDNYVISDWIFIKQGQQFQKIKIEDILYMESDNVYIYVYTPDAKLIVRSTIQAYLSILDSDKFFRVHRSFAVNILHIKSIKAETVELFGKEIPIGKSYKEALLAKLRLG